MDFIFRKTRRFWNVPGHTHFLTYACKQRLPLLTQDRRRRWVIEAFESTRSSMNLAILAYVIMPEHVHVLIRLLNPESEMENIVPSLKRSVSVAVKEELQARNATRWIQRLTVEYPTKRVFQFWQPGGGYDENLDDHEDIGNVVRYIHWNPVRRGLVQSPTDWEWSIARFWEGWAGVPIRMDNPWE